jgi:alpha-beta hydrolase superfamily lysophospholipase
VPVPTFPEPALASREDGFVQSRDGTAVYWQRFVPPSPRAAVAVLHGGGDHSGRYPGVVRALAEAGFAAALLDFRGHGRSGGRRWHVASFRDYLDDLEAFWPKVRTAAPGRPAFVLAHSQGALVALRWALAGTSTAAGEVEGFVLSSPWLGLAFEPPRLKIFAARLAGRVVPWLPVGTGLKVTDLTSDEEHQRWTEADPLYGRKTTPSWFVAAGAAQAEVVARAAGFRHPVLVLAAGADANADRAVARRFVEACGSPDREYRELAGMRHEIFNERGRERAIGDAVAWLSARASRVGAKAIDAPRP